MPKVKGKKKGIGQTDAPRRLANPSSHRLRNTTTSIGSLRRSTRIAEAENHQIAHFPPIQMTDVARRQQTGSRSIEAEIEQRLSHRRTTTRTRTESFRHRVDPRQHHNPKRGLIDIEPELNGYMLDFVVGPPSQIASRTPIGPAVTLQVRTAHPGLTSSPSDQSLHEYIAVATLVTLDSNGTLTAAAPGSLGGPQLSDSVHAPEITTSSDILGYISFPDLHVRYEGGYRIRVSLIRIGSTYGSGRGGTTLQTTDSDFFNVSNA
jgi:hypothetical protein